MSDNSKKNITIIIPTYDRSASLNRLLYYYKYHATLYPIIIADSSHFREKQKNKTIVSTFVNHGLSITYLDHFSPKIAPLYKWKLALDTVQTPYCVFSADDDFIVPESIAMSVKFLEKNLDFVVAHGTYINFTSRKKLFLWQTTYPYTSITSETARERFIAHITNYYPTIYGVCRTKVIQNAFKLTIDAHINLVYFGELCTSLQMLIYGKMKRLPIIHCARQYDARLKHWPTWRKFLRSPSFHEKLEVFKYFLATTISKKDNISYKEAQEEVKKGIEIYIAKTYPKTLINTIRNLLDYLPDSLYHQIQLHYGKLKYAQYLKKANSTLPSPETQAYSILNVIRSSVINHVPI